MKKTVVIIRIILGCFSILFGFYVLFTIGFYDSTSGFNYGSLLIFLGFLFVGILQLIKRNEPIEKKRAWLLLWTIVVVAFAILIFTVISQQKEINRINKIEQSTLMTK